MSRMTMPMKSDDEMRRAIVRLQVRVSMLVGMILGGVGIFLITAWLLVKGGPPEYVGRHLQLLGQYFIGYSVTWPGSVIGLGYGALLGGIIGGSISCIYNWVDDWRHTT